LQFALLLSLVLISNSFPVIILAQNLDSTNYRIEDPTVDSGGGPTDSSNYSLLQSLGNPNADARLTSGSYELKSGFPNGILASVPKVTCFETDTTSGTTDCLYFPNSNGAQGECGSPGCYNRAKLELDDQNNPKDTLFLVKIVNNGTSITYYLQSDHTLGLSYDINDFLTQCELEGRDPDDTGCDDSGDPNWDADLQSMNVLSLEPSTSYTASIAALNGDFTGTRFGPSASATTTATAMSFDIDISATDSETAANYILDIGEITYTSVATATDIIWLDLASNNFYGANVYVRDSNTGLDSTLTGETIPSESEDLATDPNSNGGYGLKVSSFTQTSLGPIQASATYNTGGAEQVGGLVTTDTLIFFTNTSGSNVGPVQGGRMSILVKARSIELDIASPDLADNITFIAVGNF